MSYPDPESSDEHEGGLSTRSLAGIASLGAGLAHEMNAPLSTVLTNLDVVLEQFGQLEADPDRIRPLVEALIEARAGVDRVAGIVQSLQKMGRTASEVPRASVAEGVRLGVALAGHGVRHRARLSVELNASSTVRVGIAELAELTVLLLRHAVQGLPDGGAAAHEISVTSESSGGLVAIVVRHFSASGSPAERPWPDALASRVGRARGRLTRQRFDAGSCYTLALPSGEQRPPTPRAERTSAPAPGRRGRVLLAEDDPMVRRALKRGLGSLHDLVVVESGRDALNLIAENPSFDAIVCDLMMPDITGRQLYQRLLAEHPEMVDRMIFVTGGAFTPEDQAFVDALANPVLDKPFRIGTLRDLIAASIALVGPAPAESDRTE